MKKSLLVLAVAAAVPMLAQAQTNVTLYGRIDQSIGFEKNLAGSALLLNSGVQSSNRWGLRGAEDLGGGLKAIFNLEAGFNADVGQGQGASPNAAPSFGGAAGGLDFRRRSVAGLEGGFGTLVMGRDYDPLFRVLLGSDTLGLGHYNNVHTIFGTGYGVRIDNGVHYVSPSFGGLVLRGAYGFSERFSTTTQTALVPSTTTTALVAAAPGQTKSTGRALSAAIEYATGPLYVGLGYRADTVVVANGVGFVPSNGTNKYASLGARYNFGAFAINGGVGSNNPVGANNDTRSGWFGGDAQVGPGRLHLQFGTAKTNVLGANDPKFNSVGVTYNYPLSKRTNAYVTAGVVQNNAFSSASLTTSSTAVAAGGANGDPKGVSFGLGHNF